MIQEPTPSRFQELTHLLDKSIILNQIPLAAKTEIIPLPKVQPSIPEYSKVMILENRVIKPVTVNKEERSKAIEAKLHKAVNLCKKTKLMRLSSQKSMLNKSYIMGNSLLGNTKEISVSKKYSWCDDEINPEESRKLSQSITDVQAQPVSQEKDNMKINQSAVHKLSQCVLQQPQGFVKGELRKPVFNNGNKKSRCKYRKFN